VGTPQTPDRRPIIATSWESTEGLDPVWSGYLYTATAGALSIFDEEVTAALKIRGGWYSLITAGQAVAGDYLEFSVVDKEDILGLFATYGLDPGDVLELKKYVKKDYITPGYLGRNEFEVGGAFPLVAGLFMRTAYTSIGEVDVTFKSVVKTYE
jgi:hypothetical protein